MLLIASQGKWEEGLASGVMGLTMPIKAYDLMNTLQMMLQNMDRRRRKRKKTIKSRTPEQEALIRKAKELLMARNNMTEEEAHRYIQKRSMDNGTDLTETAQMILSLILAYTYYQMKQNNPEIRNNLGQGFCCLKKRCEKILSIA